MEQVFAAGTMRVNLCGLPRFFPIVVIPLSRSRCFRPFVWSPVVADPG